MLQNKRKDQVSENESSDLEKIRAKFHREKSQVIDTKLEDRRVELIVEKEEAQACGCGGVERVRIKVVRTVPGDSPLQDGDTVSEYDDSDEVMGYE